MEQVPDNIEAFILEHHLLALGTSAQNVPQACSAFYVFIKQNSSFIIASDITTQHIKNIQSNPYVSVTIALETQQIGMIRGVQCQGMICRCQDSLEKKAYFKRFPYALAMNPTLWSIKISEIKFTDNRLGFAKKIIWRREV